MPRKRNDIVGQPEWPGRPSATDPRRALVEMEVTCGSLLVSVDGGLLPGMRSVADARSAVGVATGVAASGARAAVLISGNDLTQVVSELREAASMHLPLLIYHSCDEDHTASRASHDPIATLRDTGCVILQAADAQEVLDLGLVGRRIAEEALVPVVVAQDTFAGPKHVSTIRAPEPELLRSWIGRQGDTISSPTPSQRLLFGESRRRIPRLLNVERPVGLGARLDRESASRALAGQEVFFGEEIPKIADTAFAEFAAATGRNYEPISHYRADDADHIVVAAGRVSRALRDVVDELRTEHRKVGMVEIKMYRPMPEASLASLLSQKKGITVLESVRLGGAQDTPMMVDLRSSLSRSWNTGGSSDSGPKPSSRPRRTARDERQRPALLSAVSQNAAEASHADLRAIFDNMLAEEANVQRYHLGVRFGVPKGSRVPGLERLGQMLETAYDRLNRRGLTGAGSRRASGGEATVIKLVGMADQSVAEAGAALAVGLFRAAGGAVESRPSSTSSTEFEPETCTVCHSPANSLYSRTTRDADIVAVTRLSMSSDIELVDALRDEGRLVISSDASPQEMWVTVPDRIRKRILDKNLRLSLIPAPSVAERIAGDRWVQNHLEMQCLVGALLQAPELRLEDRKELVDSYRTALSEAWVSGDLLLEQLLQAVDRGAAEVQEVDLRSISTADAKPEKEPPAPWTVRDATEHDDSVYDAGRFWNAVGYLYASGRSEDAMVDPYVASGVLPGKTSAFRTWAPFTSRLPQLLPENCTACGACFVSCPDSALPVTVASAAELLSSVLQQAEDAGHDVAQLRRIEKHLAGQAHSLMAGDQRHEFRTLGELISAAHERLVARMDLSERDAQQIQEQTRAVAHVGRSFPISRTETFFGEPEKTEKGAGLLFSITVNADACKACGLCSAVCPDEAMEMTQSTPDLVSQYRRDWRVAMQMPATTADRIERFVSDDQPGTTAYRLLDRRAYHATLGGDSGFPGSGTRATLHLVAGIADSIVRPRVDKFHSAVENTIERLQGVIRDYVQKTVDVNDFEEFGKRLKEIDSPLLDAQRLAGLTEGGDQVDRERLLQLNTALSELDEMRSRHEFHGKDSGTSMAAAFSLAQPGSNSARYPYNPFSFPWINVAPGTAPAVAEGLLEGIGRDLIQDLRTLRKARMILDDVYEPPSNGRADSLAWTDLTDEERDLCPPVCAVVANQNEVLPNLLSLELPVKIFVLDDGSLLDAKSPRLHLWPMARPDAFVMRSTLGMHEHLLSGLTKGLGTNRPALFHLYVAEPPVDGILADMTMETMRLAAESRAFPVMIYDPDRSDTWSDCWDLGGNPDEAEDWYLRNVGVEATSGSSSRSMPFTVADWAVRMARYRRHFRHVPRNAWHGNMVPLTDFLSMEQEQRDGLQPFIEVPMDERTARVEVMPEMVAATAAALRSWRLLQELGAIESSLVERVASRLRDEFEQKTERMKKDMASDYAARLDSERQSFESRIHGRLTEELLALSGYGDDDDRARKRLLELVGVATEDGTESGGAAAATQEPGAIPN